MQESESKERTRGVQTIVKAIAGLKAYGATNASIEKLLDKPESYVEKITSADYFNGYLIEAAVIAEKNTEETLLKSCEERAIKGLMEMTTSARTESARLGAIKELMDRNRGKAPVKVESESTVIQIGVSQDEIDRMKAEEAKLDAQLAKYGVGS